MLHERGHTIKSAPRHAPWEIRFSGGNLCPILGLKKVRSSPCGPAGAYLKSVVSILLATP